MSILISSQDVPVALKQPPLSFEAGRSCFLIFGMKADLWWSILNHSVLLCGEDSKCLFWTFAEGKVLHLGFELCLKDSKHSRMIVNVSVCIDAPDAGERQLD